MNGFIPPFAGQDVQNYIVRVLNTNAGDDLKKQILFCTVDFAHEYHLTEVTKPSNLRPVEAAFARAKHEQLKPLKVPTVKDQIKAAEEAAKSKTAEPIGKKESFKAIEHASSDQLKPNEPEPIQKHKPVPDEKITLKGELASLRSTKIMFEDIDLGQIKPGKQITPTATVRVRHPLELPEWLTAKELKDLTGKNLQRIYHEANKQNWRRSKRGRTALYYRDDAKPFIDKWSK
tara:strand:+ start:294277 stop:294972 length:696 start_codon:yes stop_codon:yes gene_type:complete